MRELELRLNAVNEGLKLWKDKSRTRSCSCSWHRNNTQNGYSCYLRNPNGSMAKYHSWMSEIKKRYKSGEKTISCEIGIAKRLASLLNVPLDEVIVKTNSMIESDIYRAINHVMPSMYYENPSLFDIQTKNRLSRLEKGSREWLSTRIIQMRYIGIEGRSSEGVAGINHILNTPLVKKYHEDLQHKSLFMKFTEIGIPSLNRFEPDALSNELEEELELMGVPSIEKLFINGEMDSKYHYKLDEYEIVNCRRCMMALTLKTLSTTDKNKQLRYLIGHRQVLNHLKQQDMKLAWMKHYPLFALAYRLGHYRFAIDVWKSANHYCNHAASTPARLRKGFEKWLYMQIVNYSIEYHFHCIARVLILLQKNRVTDAEELLNIARSRHSYIKAIPISRDLTNVTDIMIQCAKKKICINQLKFLQREFDVRSYGPYLPIGLI